MLNLDGLRALVRSANDRAEAAQGTGRSISWKFVRDFADKLQSEIDKLAASQPESQKAVGYTAFALVEGNPVALMQYAGQFIHNVEARIMDGARREKFQGTLNERMRELGWTIEALYTHPSPQDDMVIVPKDALSLAIMFHHHYERLAPSKGYNTRVETRIFQPDSANGKLMVATCQSILDAFAAAPKPEDRT